METPYYKRNISETLRANEWFYIVHENLEFLISSGLFGLDGLVPSELGDSFINILNDRNNLFKILDEYLKNIKKCETFEKCDLFLSNFIFSDNFYYLNFNNIYNNIFEYLQKLYIDESKKYRNKDSLKIQIENIKKSIRINTILLEEIKKISLAYNGETLINKIVDINNEFLSLDELKYLYADNSLLQAKKNLELNLKLDKENLTLYKSLNDKPKIKKITNNLEKYINDIKSIINNFLIFIESEDDELKTKIKMYLLWTAQIPKVKNNFATIDEGEYYFHNACNFDYFVKNKYIGKLIPSKIYTISDFRQLLDLYVDLYLQNKFSIKKCENCGKYFIPKRKSNEIYCENIFKNNLTCRDYAPKMKYRKNIETDKIKNLNYKFGQRYTMKIKREEKYNKRELLRREFEKYKEEYNNKKELNKKGKLKDDDFIKWLENQFKEYDGKYSKKKKSNKTIKEGEK